MFSLVILAQENCYRTDQSHNRERSFNLALEYPNIFNSWQMARYNKWENKIQQKNEHNYFINARSYSTLIIRVITPG